MAANAMGNVEQFGAHLRRHRVEGSIPRAIVALHGLLGAHAGGQGARCEQQGVTVK